MDKQLIQMCDCPEIQDRWEPKSGDRFQSTIPHYNKGIFTLVHEDECESPDSCDCCGWKDIESHGIFIPRIEDVLEWLDKPFWDRVMHTMLDYRYTDTAPPSVWRDPLKSFIAYFMHHEHNKTWDGEKWI